MFDIVNRNKTKIDQYFWKYYENTTIQDLERFIHKMRDFNEPFGNILSVGCGHGLNEILIAEICNEVDSIKGIDLKDFKIKSMNVIVNLMSLKNVRGLVGDGEKLDFSSESFESVIIIESLSHVRNQVEVLEEAVRVMKKDGRIFVMDNNNGANPRILYKRWYENYLKGEIDENPVNPYFIKNRLSELGVTDIEIISYNYGPFFRNFEKEFFLKMPFWFQLLFSVGFMLKGTKS